MALKLPQTNDPWPDGVERGRIVFDTHAVVVWTAKIAGEHACVSVLQPTANETLTSDFAKAARSIEQGPGVLPIRDIDEEGRFVVHAPVVGALVDAPSLGWKLARRLELFMTLCEHVSAIHRGEKAHGGLTPWSVALDDAMAPLLVSSSGNGIWAAGDGFEYIAPELMFGAEPTRKADIYALGRILAFLIVGAHPAPEQEPVPKLDYLSSAPAGLSRIVRRCTLANAELRYDSVAELISDVRSYGDFEKVGLALATAIELNKTGMSKPPERTTRAIHVAAPVHQRATPAEVKKAAAAKPAARPNTPPDKKAEPAEKKKPPTAALAALSLLLVVVFGLTLGEDAFRAIVVWQARRSLASEAPADRVHGIQKLIGLGESDFQKINLARVKLDGATLAGGNFRGATFTDATALGADMSDTNVIETLNLESVTCDDATRMPQGWLCTNGHFANAP